MRTSVLQIAASAIALVNLVGTASSFVAPASTRHASISTQDNSKDSPLTPLNYYSSAVIPLESSTRYKNSASPNMDSYSALTRVNNYDGRYGYGYQPGYSEFGWDRYGRGVGGQYASGYGNSGVYQVSASLSQFCPIARPPQVLYTLPRFGFSSLTLVGPYLLVSTARVRLV